MRPCSSLAMAASARNPAGGSVASFFGQLAMASVKSLEAAWNVSELALTSAPNSSQ